MKTALLIAAFCLSCAQIEQPKEKPAETGACAYSWDLGGTWITWCYENRTQEACDAMDNSTGFAVLLKNRTCPAAGYPIRCPSGAYKNSACAWYE